MKARLKSEYLDYLVNSMYSAGLDEAVLELHDSRWLLKMRGPSNVILVAMMIPEEQMEQYDRGGYERIGLKLPMVETFVSSGSEYVNMWMESRTLWMQDDEGAEAKIATVDPETVAGVMDGTIKTDFEVELSSSLDIFTDFINRGEDMTGDDNYMISCREEGLYLYMRGDNSTYRKFYEWDEFGGHNIDWSINNLGEADTALVPKNDKGLDVIMSTDFTKSINDLDDEAAISIANHHPMKIVYDKLGDENKPPIKVSYIQTPRIDEDWGTLPEEALE